MRGAVKGDRSECENFTFNANKVGYMFPVVDNATKEGLLSPSSEIKLLFALKQLAYTCIILLLNGNGV